jgi:hypothetical protein
MMSSLMDLVTSQLGASLPDLSKALGTDEKQTGQAVSMALPAILGALTRNASRSDGAQSLAKALAKDHDGSILNNVPGFLNSGDTAAGDGILEHVLGSKRARVESGVSQGSGLDPATVTKLMTTLAPLVMGMLGRAQREQRLNPTGMAGLLDSGRKEFEAREPQTAGLLSNLLDTDGDGDLDLGDIVRHGSGLLGKFMGGK